MTLFSGLGTDVHFSGETGLQLSLRVVVRRGVANGDVERSDTRHEFVAQRVQWRDAQSAH